jgi:hypothetical protein
MDGQLEGCFGELEGGAVWRGEGEVAPRLWLDGTENIGCAATFVFVILTGLAARLGR